MTYFYPFGEKDLHDLILRARIAVENGDQHDESILKLRNSTDYPRLDDLLFSDHSERYIAEFITKWKAEWPTMTRSELISLVNSIMSGEGSEACIALDVLCFEANCRHPGGSDLLFYPDEYFANEPTAEEIVDLAKPETQGR